jgi:hypothetical protein
MKLLDAIGSRFYFVNIMSFLFLNNIYLFFSSKWNPRQSIDLINLISRWKVCLPQQIFEHIRDKCIVPKLKLEISSFDPVSNAIPIKELLNPWEELFGNYLKELYQ